MKTATHQPTAAPRSEQPAKQCEASASGSQERDDGGRPRARIAKRRAAAQCTANTLSDHEHTHARRTTPGRRAPERGHGHASSTQPAQTAQPARTNAANAAAAARARCIAARRGGHLATTHAPNATAADQRQQHSTRQAHASRKHAAKPDSASRKQHRPGQQGLHCRAASQAPSSTTQTARTTTDARSEPHAALRAASLGPWAIASAAEACIARRRPRLHFHAPQQQFQAAHQHGAARRTHAAHGAAHTVLVTIEPQQQPWRASSYLERRRPS
jgi:hypothetical protein